jgi:hypothetical protein
MTLALAITAFASLSYAHYHFIHFNSRTGPWQGMPEKFDLNSLPNKTLTYFVTDQTGAQLAQNDSYVGLISQIRAAGKVWNDVESSDLRLAFGGFAAPKTPQAAPSLEIIFDEVPPGLIAMGGPEVKVESNGQFVPIQKSVVILNPDLRNLPSFSEKLFGTLVHEIGHGLGLQHTFTSSVMSTFVTRSTSRGKPLTTDDVAAISLLYPTRSFTQNTGSISGRVTMSGAGVNLASVVAISPSGPAISTLTNPDGTYQIAGLPPRQYFVYVHPLPPARQGQATPGDIVFPVDSDGRSFGPGDPFLTIFYPGTNDPSRAFTVAPAPGSNVENIDFSVRSRSGYTVHSVDTYAYPGAFAVKPPYLSPNILYPFILAGGSGLFSGNSMAPGLSVSVLGGASLSIRPYSQAPTSFVQIDFDPRTLSISSDSARHLVFSQNGDIYVLPAAFFHVDKLPPTVSSVIPVLDGTQRLAMITGTNLTEASRVFFDGVPANIRDFDSLSGRLTVVPPAAPANHRASVVVLNPDGQSSLFLQGNTPSTYTYFGEPPALATAVSGLTVTPAALPAGTDAMLQIETTGASFVDGQTVVGFGSSDIVVKQVSVVSPTKLLVNVSINPTASVASAHLSVIAGLQLISQQYAFQVLPSTRTFWLSSNINNATTGLPGVTAGAQAVLTVGSAPVPLTSSNITLFLNDQAIPVSGVQNNQITFQIPANVTPGGVVLRLEVSGDRSLPILMIIDPPLPKILSAVSDNGDSGSSLRLGQLVALTVSNLQAAGSAVDTERIAVNLAGTPVRVAQILEQSDVHKVLVYVPATSPVGTELPLTVSVDSRTSDPIAVSIED